MAKENKKTKLPIKNFRNRDFSEYCEYIVAFKLQELGWKVFQPLVDRYIDIVAIKKNNEGEILLRTIQVKSSRVESAEGEDPESYGLTHQPKDLLHDPRHFFIWVFIDNKNNINFFIISVDDFIDVRSVLLPPSSRRKHASLLMRGEWRWGTDRMHPKHWINYKGKTYKKVSKNWKVPQGIKNPSWTLENTVLDQYLNAWDNLETVKKKNLVSRCILAQEINKDWAVINKLIITKWEGNNKFAYERLKKYPNILKSVSRLDSLGVEDEE